MIQQDWLLRQIETIINSMAALLFGKKSLRKVFFNFEQETGTQEQTIEIEVLKNVVNRYLEEGQVNEAKELIYSSINNNKTLEKLIFALSFYDKLLKFNEDQLLKYNLSKNKIKNEIDKLKDLYLPDG